MDTLIVKAKSYLKSKILYLSTHRKAGDANIANSVFISWLSDNKGLIAVCSFVSAFLCILTYPGILYSDSFGRIEFTVNLKEALYSLIHNHAVSFTSQSWLTFVPSFFILFSEEMVGSIVLYTFVQCFFLFFMTFIFGDNVTQRANLWNRICIFLCPLLWGYGIYYESSVGCVIAILGILLLIWKWDLFLNFVDRIISCGLLLFLSFVCFGYRANAFSIIPALFIICLLKEKDTIRRIVILSLVCGGFGLTIVIPKILNIDTMSSYAGSFVWETVSTIQMMDEEKQEKYKTYLDDIFGDGTTEIAIQNNSVDNINSIWWGNPFDSYTLSIQKNTKQVLKKYVMLILDEPQEYSRTKCYYILRTMGVKTPLAMNAYDYNAWNRMDDYNYNDSPQRLAFVNGFLSFMRKISVFRTPWIMFLIALILILFLRCKVTGWHKEINIYEGAFLIAVFYYGAFLLNNQSFEFRYFFPSFLLLYVTITSSVADIMCNITSKKVAERVLK